MEDDYGHAMQASGRAPIMAVLNLDRFVTAQQGVFDGALAEIQGGRKRGHWMWFIFPQLAGLGRSAMAQYYAIGSLDEARAYFDHPLLGSRLRACVEALQDRVDGTAAGMFGEVDALKLRSSLTLFVAAGGGRLFDAALERWFDGRRDAATLAALGIAGPAQAGAAAHLRQGSDGL